MHTVSTRAKKRYAVLPFLLVLLGLSWSGIILADNPSSRLPESSDVIEPAPETSWYTWYQQNAGYSPTNAFGIYAVQPVGSALYVGLGSGAPAAYNGGMVVRVDAAGTTPIASGLTSPAYSEQGIHDLLWDGARLHIAGTDPCCGDDQSLGNHYTYEASSDVFRKYRDGNGLNNVVHTWGLFEESGRLYMAASGTGSETCTYIPGARGMIFESVDNGATWQHLSDLGCYRAYDIIGVKSGLVAIYKDGAWPMQWAFSVDNGSTWQALPLPKELRSTRMVEFNSRAVGASKDGRTLLSVQQHNNVRSHALPDGLQLADGFNTMATDGDRLFVLMKAATGESHIVYTSNLNRWRTLAVIEQPLSTIAFWPATNSVIVGGVGPDAELLSIPLR